MGENIPQYLHYIGFRLSNVINQPRLLHNFCGNGRKIVSNILDTLDGGFFRAANTVYDPRTFQQNTSDWGVGFC